ncbi:MAG: CRTAC1 family protein, partial [Polyangiales bacterium]
SELIINEGATADAPIHFKRPDRKEMGLDVPHPSSDWNEGGIMAASGDLDLDGREDIILAASDYPGNFSEVYVQKEDGTFADVAEAIGLHHGCTNGVAVADFDRDGDLDVIVGSSTARDCIKLWPRGNEVHFYENALNDGPSKRAFLQVQLAGKGAGKSNATGIGARVKVAVGGRVITKELTGGYGHFGMQHDTVLTFGLGASCAPQEIEVRWPDAVATKVRYTGVGGGQRVLVTEDGTVTALP